MLRRLDNESPGRRLTRKRASWAAALGIALASALFAHPDLELRIEAVGDEIEASPENASLYLQRADLYRRHEDWAAARADIDAARRLAPGLGDIDWVEGRMLVESGHPAEGERLLTRYLEVRPVSPAAVVFRARARLALGAPLDAAADYGHAVALSTSPGPGLFRSWAEALCAAGKPHWPEAQAVVEEGLVRYPTEVGLLGLKVDIALASGTLDPAGAGIAALPGALVDLPQWRYRSALLACQRGEVDIAAAGFRELEAELAQGDALRAGTFEAQGTRLTELASSPDAALCQAVASARLPRSPAGD